MSADRPDPRNPLARALDEASSGPDARGYTVAVDLVRRRAGRRRALRTGGVAALALAVVAGGGAGIAAGAAAWRGGTVAPGPSDGQTVESMADWPGQFAYCGKPIDEVAPPPLSSARLIVEPVAETMPADGAWTGSVTTDVPLAGEQRGWVWGTDLLVVRDGVVVGVQRGAQVPSVPDLDAYLGGAEPSFATAPFPLVTDVSAGLASCDPYPSGEGSPVLAAGTYDLVVAQTVSYLPAEGGRADLRLGTQATVTIVEAPPSPQDRPAACGASDEQLTLLSNPQSNPAPLEVSVLAHPSPSGYDHLPLTPRLTNTGTQTLHGYGGSVRLVVTQDGAVVGGSAVWEPTDPDDRVTLTAGASVDLGDPPQPTSCPGGGPLPAGDYELWILADLTSADGETLQSASPPMPWTVTAETPASEPSEDQVAAWTLQRDTLFECHRAPDAQGITAVQGLSSAQPPSVPVVVGRTDFSTTTWGASVPEWSATLTPFGTEQILGQYLEVDVLAVPTLAFVGPDGLVAGFSVPSGSGVQRGPVDASGLQLTGGPSYLVGCGAEGPATSAGAEEGLPPGTYTAYPMVPVVVTHDVYGGEDYADAAAGVVLLVGPTQTVTFGGP